MRPIIDLGNPGRKANSIDAAVAALVSEYDVPLENLRMIYGDLNLELHKRAITVIGKD